MIDNILDKYIVDNIVDHDVYNPRPRREVKEVKEKDLKDLDTSITQIQIVEV